MKIFNQLILGWVLIDRDGKHFGFILNYLRNGEISLPESRPLCEEILTGNLTNCELFILKV